MILFSCLISTPISLGLMVQLRNPNIKAYILVYLHEGMGYQVRIYFSQY